MPASFITPNQLRCDRGGRCEMDPWSSHSTVRQPVTGGPDVEMAGDFKSRSFSPKQNGAGPDMLWNEVSERLVVMSVRMAIVVLALWRRLNAITLENKGGTSYSIEVYDFLQALKATVSSKVIRASVSLLGLVGTPLFFYNCIPSTSPLEFVKAIIAFWDGCLFLSSPMVFCGCIMLSFYYATTNQNQLVDQLHRGKTPEKAQDRNCRERGIYFVMHSKKLRFYRLAFAAVCFLVYMVAFVGPWTLFVPSWIWHPFLWGSYRVIWPSKLAQAMHGLCVDYSLDEGKNGLPPLCISPDSWNTLSTGALSSKSPADVKAVLDGIKYARQISGGVIISVLARDVEDFVAPLRQNVESLVPFFSNVAVVVFENDSVDGSREAFKRWGQVVRGYELDLIECDGAVDCKLGQRHRDEVEDFSYSSAVGDMHKYRQKIVDYVLEKPKYKDFSHMLVLDIDLGVSISPLGILHALGTRPDNPVASAGRQPWPTSFGSLITPYDFSAFRSYPTEKNARLRALHEAFCNLMPEKNRWRNECHALSPLQMIQVLMHDRTNAALVRVEAAFNGAVLYPLKLIRDSGATYDSGEDGQRCEHVGFQSSLGQPMYMDRKWDMHLSPTIPGGPNGQRAQRTASRIFSTPKLNLVLQVIHLSLTACFVMSTMALGAFILYPILLDIQCYRQNRRGIKPSNRLRRKSSLNVKTV